MEPSSHARNKDVCTKLGAVTPEPSAIVSDEDKRAALQLSLKKQASELVKTRTTELKLALFSAVTPERFTRIVEKVVERAENGHEKSLNLLFKYFVAKPGDKTDEQVGVGSGAPYSININVVSPTAPNITIQESNKGVEGGESGA